MVTKEAGKEEHQNYLSPASRSIVCLSYLGYSKRRRLGVGDVVLAEATRSLGKPRVAKAAEVSPPLDPLGAEWTIHLIVNSWDHPEAP